MHELIALRQRWDEIEAEETRLLRLMSIQDSVRQWLRLQQAFEDQLKQTAEMFGPDHWAALAELQARLQQLAAKGG
ncbi:MAG TPA: hypothetical protein VFK30_07660 [Anaerolineae bacterium]|nr:hypothetical protein [Anaerolineae bacterium]